MFKIGRAILKLLQCIGERLLLIRQTSNKRNLSNLQHCCQSPTHCILTKEHDVQLYDVFVYWYQFPNQCGSWFTILFKNPVINSEPCQVVFVDCFVNKKLNSITILLKTVECVLNCLIDRLLHVFTNFLNLIYTTNLKL